MSGSNILISYADQDFYYYYFFLSQDRFLPLRNVLFLMQLLLTAQNQGETPGMWKDRLRSLFHLILSAFHLLLELLHFV